MHTIPIHEVRITVATMTGPAFRSEFLRPQEAVQVVRAIRTRALNLEWLHERLHRLFV